jgi:hypothetical protein
MVYFTLLLLAALGMRWHSRLKQGATSQKVVGLIPDGVNGIFH